MLVLEVVFESCKNTNKYFTLLSNLYFCYEKISLDLEIGDCLSYNEMMGLNFIRSSVMFV